MIKPVRMLLIVVITLFLLTGCWNRLEINDIAIVTAIGLDLVKGDRLRLSLQVAIPSKLGTDSGGGESGGKSTIVLSETGATISEAYRNIQRKLPRRIFFSQSRVLLIGEDLAKKGVAHIIDFHTRYTETRINSFIMFTKGKASTILKSLPNFESISAEEMKELGKLNIGLRIYVRDFMNMLLTDGQEPVASRFSLEPLEVYTKDKSEKVQSINGAAVFKKDKLIGWMDEVETRGLLWLRNEIKSGVINIQVPKEKGGGNISMEIIKTNVKFAPKREHGALKMVVNVTSALNVLENDSSIKLFDTKELKAIQKKTANEIRERIQGTVDLTQKEYQSDILGFGESVYKKYPKEWKAHYKKNWDHEFPNLEVTIHSKAFVRKIGLTK